MSSQNVCDYVRRHIAQHESLGKICESIIDYCIAPDADLEKSGVGCDNMTIVIVAILHGRTLEEWYDWVSDRVERGHGYETPTEFRPLYGPRRGYSWDFSHNAGGRVAFDLRIPVYADDSSDEDMEEESEDGQGLFGAQAQGEGKGKGKAVVGKGKGKEVARPDGEGSAERDADMEAGANEGAEGAEYESEESSEDGRLPPGFTRTGLTSVGRPLVAGPPELKNLGAGAGGVKPEKQLVHLPEGDAPSSAVRVEGLMDTSEDPTRTEV